MFCHDLGIVQCSIHGHLECFQDSCSLNMFSHHCPVCLMSWTKGDSLENFKAMHSFFHFKALGCCLGYLCFNIWYVISETLKLTLSPLELIFKFVLKEHISLKTVYGYITALNSAQLRLWQMMWYLYPKAFLWSLHVIAVWKPFCNHCS